MNRFKKSKYVIIVFVIVLLVSALLATTYSSTIVTKLGDGISLVDRVVQKPFQWFDSVKSDLAHLTRTYNENESLKKQIYQLEVKSNDYFSIKPEIGAELGFKHHFDRKTVRVGVSVAYENELGRVANAHNKARVAYTTADWYNLRGEKEDRRGNVKTDLNIGVDNQRIGVTGNVGYDTKGSNIRGGLGLRVIF